MSAKAIVIGNSDGIGLALTRRLLDKGWRVDGISRSPSQVLHQAYSHATADVAKPEFPELMRSLLTETPDLCVYCAGIGELLDPRDMYGEVNIFQVNLMGMVTAAAMVIPAMVEAGQGHFMGISSMADVLLSAEAPSYHGSKAGFSNYLEGLARSVRPLGVRVTNVRFGFVDTKMAKGDVKPFMMSVDKAVDHLERCMNRRPPRYSAPAVMRPLIGLRRLMMNLGLA